MSDSDTPSMAISFRFEHRDGSKLRSRYRHDQRSGPQPKYIDGERTPNNSTIIPYAPIPQLKAMCQERRSGRETKRAMKSNAAVGSSFIITFGKGLQPHVDALPRDAQDQLYAAVAHAVGKRLDEAVSGLIAHRDETSPHAHGVFPAVAKDGRPFSKVITRQIASEIQQIAEDAARPHLPMIEGRKTKAQRIEDGEDLSRIYHRTVRQLHDDLPKELAQVKGRLADLAQAETDAAVRVDEMRGRVEKLTAKAELTDKEVKRLQTYEKRLADRLVELEAAQAASEASRAEADRLADLARTDRQDEEVRAENIRAKVDAVTDAVASLAYEISARTIKRTPEGKITAAAPDRLKPAFPEIRPAVAAAADLVTGIEASRADLAADQKELAAGQRDLIEGQMQLMKAAEEVETLRQMLRKALRRVVSWLKRPELADDIKDEGACLVDDLKPLLKSAPEEPPEDAGPGF